MGWSNTYAKAYLLFSVAGKEVEADPHLQVTRDLRNLGETRIETDEEGADLMKGEVREIGTGILREGEFFVFNYLLKVACACFT